MNREFNAFDNNDEKCSIFKKKLPEDKRLHRFYRRVNLLEELEGFKARDLSISDETIDTESNLWYIVLQKNLYKVGLPIDLFDDLSKDIDSLVNITPAVKYRSFYLSKFPPAALSSIVVALATTHSSALQMKIYPA